MGSLPKSSIIEISGLTFGYNNRPVLRDVNLTIHKGDFMGIVGPNGSAKTTLLKLMLGLLTPWSGEVRLFGEPISSFRQWGRVGYVAQRAAAFNMGFPATVEEVVAANLFSHVGLFRGLKPAHWQKVSAALKTVGLERKRQCLIGHLSGGEQQRVFIARVLVSDPELLLLDEPTVGVDIQAQEHLYELLERLNKERQMTIVMVSHDVGVVTERVNRVACLNDSRLFVHEKPADLLKPENIAAVYGIGMQPLIHCHEGDCGVRINHA